MPAYHSSSPSLSSFSSNSSQQLALTESPNVSFLDYVKLLDNNNSFDALKVALFEQQDLVVKTNEMRHLAPLIERLQDEANRQQEYMEEIFNGIEAVGLHQILKKYFVRENGTIKTRRRVKFDLP